MTNDKLYKEYVEKVGMNIAAEIRTKRPVIRELMDVIDDANGTVTLHEEKGGPLLLVVTNANGWFGAACIFREDVQEMLADRFGGDFYIFPSSIHEVITAGVGSLGFDTDETEYCKNMIREINQTTVLEDDVLSDSLYRYNSREKRIEEVA